MDKIGIVVGHNEMNQGAINYLGETEFLYNKRIAAKLFLKLRDIGINAAIITRPSLVGYHEQVKAVLEQVKHSKVDLTFHLHFNSFGSPITGCEALIVRTKDSWIADSVTDMLNETFGIKERAQDGVKLIDILHSGYDMLKAVTDEDVPGITIEPTFANHRHHESKIIFEKEDAYVDLLVVCIKGIKDQWK